MNQSHKEWIDTASYEQLLRRWRFAESGDTIFQGESGKYYADMMAKRKEIVGDKEHTRTSKCIGW